MRIRALGLVAVLSLLPLSVGAQDANDRLTLDLYLEYESVSNPRLSPDGQQVIYTREWVDKVHDRRKSSLWIMGADGSRNRFLVEGSGARWGGGANWSGAAVDPETGLLYVPSVSAHTVIPFADADPNSPATMRYIWRWGQGGGGPTMPQGLPLWKPPYSRMTAIDMNRGARAWMTPLGDGDRISNLPMLRDLDLPPLGGDGRGGPLLTKTLLISALTAGGTGSGPRLVAYDKVTGEMVGSVDLPGGALGTPMTYMLDGRQYIALTVGGPVPELVAFRLVD